MSYAAIKLTSSLKAKCFLGKSRFYGNQLSRSIATTTPHLSSYLNLSRKAEPTRLCFVGKNIFGTIESSHQPSSLLLQPAFARSNSTQEKPEAAESTPKKNESNTSALKKMLAQYGAFGLTVHILISLVYLGVTYLLVYWGLDVQKLFDWSGIDMSALPAELAQCSTTFIAAYTVHKLIMPLRAGTSVIVVPLLVRYLRKIGRFK